MMKKIISVLLIVIMFIFPLNAFAQNENAKSEFPLVPGSTGDDVLRMQTRLQELGYINFRATGRFADMTYRGVISFQKQNEQTPDGIVSSSVYQSIFDNNVKRNIINPNFRRVSGPGLLATPTEFGTKGSWDQIEPLFTSAPTKIIDFNTRKEFTVYRVGGENHAHVVPASKSDYNAFLSCFGGEYTWEKRPVLVALDEIVYAASLFGMPNVANSDSDCEFMEGSLCLYFNGCSSHIAGISDSEHRTNIETASNSQ